MIERFLDIGVLEIIAKLKNKQISVMDITMNCIAQIEKYDHKYKVWEFFDPDILIAQAKKSKEYIEHNNQNRTIEGIPVGVKDIFNTMDFPTQMGSPIWKNFNPGNDARVLYHIKDNGGIIPGKTVTAEFGVHYLGETLNPHNSMLTPGTSSSGSAVAIATGMVPFSIGTQTAGSIVRPASFCGIYGCKPSFGLIPRTGMLKTTDSLDTIGFFAAHYEDLGLFFNILRVHGPNYPFSNTALDDASRQEKPMNRPWKVVFAKTHTWQYAPDYAKKDLTKWLEGISRLKEYEVEEIELPGSMKYSHEIHSILYDKTLSYYFKEEAKQKKLISPIMNKIVERGYGISLKKYLQALENQCEMVDDMDNFMSKYEIVISLSTAGEAPLRETEELPDPALMWNMTYLPVISAPVFVSPDNNPFAIQIVARRYNDKLLFKFTDSLREKGFIPKGLNPKLPKFN